MQIKVTFKSHGFQTNFEGYFKKGRREKYTAEYSPFQVL